MTVKPFSLLIKPASGDCNFGCDYCFYLRKAELYPQKKIHRMNTRVLEKMIRGYMETEQPVHSFGWQGGEPLLMGIDFFKEALGFQETYGRRGLRVSNGLQTNGSLITPDLARLFREYNFLIGISIDGPEEIHDRFRHPVGGFGTYRRVLEGLENLRREEAETNVLTLVTAASADHPEAVFRHLVEDLGFRYLQFIPCVEYNAAENGPNGYGAPKQGADAAGAPSAMKPWTVTPKQWGTFLSAVFDEWQVRWRRKVSVRNFDAVLHLLVDGVSVSCDHGSSCDDYLVVEHNGDVYPCDFFVEPELKLGNCTESSWEALRSSSLYSTFGKQKRANSKECGVCPYTRLCRGDCVKHRGPGMENAGARSYLCEGLKLFYHHALPGFLRMAENYRKRA